jgi:hypothetical protein
MNIVDNNQQIKNTQSCNNNQSNNKKPDTIVDYKYICIKKDYFDVSLVQLNYTNIKKNNHIEIIYKSPSILLEGLFFKTPPISSNTISIFHKEKNLNNITIKLLINQKEHSQFIQILRSIDEHVSGYINKFSTEIENELNNDVQNNNIHNNNPLNLNHLNHLKNTNYINDRTLSMFKYEQIIKYNYHRSGYNNETIKNNEEKIDTYQIYLKSYLDKNTILELEKQLNKKYIFTFNISNIYLCNNSLLPLIKCNRCEVVD